jgi:hypothetical protein
MALLNKSTFLKNCCIICLLSYNLLCYKVSLAQGNNATIISKSSAKLNTTSSSKIKKEDSESPNVNIKNNKVVNTSVPKTKINSQKIEGNPKKSFILYLNTDAKHKEQAYINALNQFLRLENHRLISKRRSIELANNEGKIELFSANELLQLYGRSIRPQNLKDNATVIEIELLLSEEGFVKEQLKK